MKKKFICIITAFVLSRINNFNKISVNPYFFCKTKNLPAGWKRYLLTIQTTNLNSKFMKKTEINKKSIDARLKRIKFRAWHRGTKEMDLLLGSFVDKSLSNLTELDLDELERIIECNDIDLYSWISGREPIPTEINSAMMNELKAHSLSNNS